MNVPQSKPRIKAGDPVLVYEDLATVDTVLKTGVSTVTPAHELALITYRVGGLLGSRQVTAVHTSHGWKVSTDDLVAKHAATAPWANE